MATLSVVQYNTSPHKSNVLQQSTNSNNNTDRKDIIILRKNSPVTDKILNKPTDILNTRKKVKPTKELTRIPNPPPLAVARRNARERNRVKQVNNGFANLRQHIPNCIAAAFESSSSRGGNKKLSKVETLRMAVEYIRSLEEILSISDGGSANTSSVSEGAGSSCQPSTPSPPVMTNIHPLSYSYPILSPEEESISTNPTPPPQYVRINGINSFQIIPVHLYENSENLEPLEVDEDLLSDPSLIAGDLQLTAVQDLSLLNSINTNASLSPEVYSDSSLSPGLDKNNHPGFIPMFNMRPDVKIKVEPDILSSASPLSEDLSSPSNNIVSMTCDAELHVKQADNINELINWWNTQDTARS